MVTTPCEAAFIIQPVLYDIVSTAVAKTVINCQALSSIFLNVFKKFVELVMILRVNGKTMFTDRFVF